MDIKESCKALLDEFGLPDYAYDVRSRAVEGGDFEGNSWDHPKVVRFGECVEAVRAFVVAADRPVLVFVFDSEQDIDALLHSVEIFPNKTIANVYEQGIDDACGDMRTLSWPFEVDDLEDIAPSAEPEELEALMTACVARGFGAP